MSPTPARGCAWTKIWPRGVPSAAWAWLSIARLNVDWWTYMWTIPTLPYWDRIVALSSSTLLSNAATFTARSKWAPVTIVTVNGAQFNKADTCFLSRANYRTVHTAILRRWTITKSGATLQTVPACSRTCAKGGPFAVASVYRARMRVAIFALLSWTQAWAVETAILWSRI